jgi:hypothetical protein
MAETFTFSAYDLDCRRVRVGATVVVAAAVPVVERECPNAVFAAAFATGTIGSGDSAYRLVAATFAQHSPVFPLCVVHAVRSGVGRGLRREYPPSNPTVPVPGARVFIDRAAGGEVVVRVVKVGGMADNAALAEPSDPTPVYL